MKIPRYWVKGFPPGQNKDTADIAAWGWSFTDPEEARRMATEKAGRIEKAMASRSRLDRYAYGDAPLREEVLETLGDAAEPFAVITRNRYGARVLNTASVLFVDVDIPEAKPAGFMDALRLAFSARRRQEQEMAAAKVVLAAVAAWWEKNRAHALRIYRTAAGLRLLFTDKLYAPATSETDAIMQGLKADPLYVRLCKAQASFRARLTPKPWRCDCPNPPNQYPWDSTEAEALYREWEGDYRNATAGLAVCQYLSTLGSAAIAADVQPIVDLHDKACCGPADAPLA